MTTTRARTVGLLVVAVLGLTIAPVASASIGVTAGTVDVETNAESETGTDESAPDATVSSFMQSTAADAEHTVESGMFEARYENADEDQRAALVTERVDELEAELAALEAEREELEAEAAEANAPGRYRARMTKLTVEIAGLERAIERTERRAAETGVEDERLADLKANASAIANSEAVTKTARGLAGFDRHPGIGAGPPVDRGNAGDVGLPPGQQDRANGTAATGGADTGSETDPGNGPSSEAPGNSDGADKSAERDERDVSQPGNEPNGNGDGDGQGANDANADGDETDGDDDSEAGGGPPEFASH